MTLDTLDQAFLDHWSAMLAASGPREVGPVVTATSLTAAPPTAAPHPPVVADEAEPTDVVGRLLRAAWNDWCAVADEIEAARRRGRRVIAVIACERGAGCTTLVAGLVRVFESRGRDVGVATLAADPPDGPTHGRRILLVDAGVWFPPGRINRGRLMIASGGCDAAILVRREDRPAPTGWSVALEAIGVEPLGEVISFAGRPAGTCSGADR